jgi:hypothetical protein
VNLEDNFLCGHAMLCTKSCKNTTRIRSCFLKIQNRGMQCPSLYLDALGMEGIGNLQLRGCLSYGRVSMMTFLDICIFWEIAKDSCLMSVTEMQCDCDVRLKFREARTGVNLYLRGIYQNQKRGAPVLC